MRADSGGGIFHDLTGLTARDEEHVTGPKDDRRPLAMAWVSDELLADTIAVWSRNYGRPVPEDEAMEILMNAKRFAEVLLEARKEVNST